MFASTAFPRIPFIGGDSISDSVSDSVSESTNKPPVVPFDALVQAASAVPRHTETHRRNAVSIARYEDVAVRLESDDAREFLAALVFLGTRSTIPGKTSVVGTVGKD